MKQKFLLNFFSLHRNYFSEVIGIEFVFFIFSLRACSFFSNRYEAVLCTKLASDSAPFPCPKHCFFRTHYLTKINLIIIRFHYYYSKALIAQLVERLTFGRTS